MSATSKVLITLALAAALGAGGWYGYTRYYAAPKAQAQKQMPRMRGIAVRTELAAKEDVELTILALGTVTANQTSKVVSQVQGYLTDVLFKEGDFVNKGDLLAKVDTRQHEASLKQYTGTLAQIKANLANARSTLERYQKLFKTDSVSRQTLDAQIAQVNAYEGNLKSVQGQIESAKVSISYGQIKAPISGYIGIRGVDVGNLVGPSATSAIATITETTPISVIFSVPQASLSQAVAPFRAGEKLSVEVFDQDNRKRLATGAVSAIDNQVDTATGTVRVKALFDNADGALFPNQFVNVRLVYGKMKDAVVISSSAIQTTSSSQYVFVVKDDGKAYKRVIRQGPSKTTTRVAVLRGLQPGEQIVTVGADSLSDGTPVNIVKEAQVDTSNIAPSGNRRRRGPGGR
jgi:multidrug efflux system membrane fusion protein